MENSFNEVPLSEGDALQTNSLLTNPQQDVEGSIVLGQDSLDQEDPKPKPKTATVKSKTIVPKVSKIVPSKSVVSKSTVPDVTKKEDSHALENFGVGIKSPRVGDKETTFAFDYDSYAPYFGNNMGTFYPSDTPALDLARAHTQGVVEQFKNASIRVGENIVPEIISQLANVVDLEDYANSDAEVGNWLTTYMQNVQQENNKSNPIYRVDPTKPLDFKDSAWWFENGASLVTSAGAFVATGYLTGAVAGTAATKIGQGAKWAKSLGKASALASGEAKVARAGGSILNAIALNQAEGLGIGVDTFKQEYEKQIAELKSSPDSVDKSEEELDKTARQLAADAATSAIKFNRLNILFNLTSASAFLKTPKGTRDLLSIPTIKHSILGLIGEGGQESAEELLNDVSQQQALDQEYSFTKAMKHAMSAQGQESMLLGFIGGAGQTALTKAGKYIPMYKNKDYNRAYNTAYNKLDDSVAPEERHAIATRSAVESAGKSGMVSQDSIDKRRYAKQQEALLRNDAGLTVDKVSDITAAYTSAEENIRLLTDIKEAKDKGDSYKVEQLNNLLLSNQALNNFELGTTESFIDLHKGYANLTAEEAENKGLPKDYKAKAEGIIKHIETLENIYNNSKQYINNADVYHLEEKKIDIKSKLDENLDNIRTAIKKAEEVYHPGHPKAIGKEMSYIDGDSPTGYNLNKVNPSFKKTKQYYNLRTLHKVDTELRKTLYNTEESEGLGLQPMLDIITSSDYQSELKQNIKENQRREKVANKRSYAKELRTQATDKVQGTLNSIRNSITPSTDIITEAKAENIVIPQPGQTQETTPTTVEDKGTKPKAPILVDFPVFGNEQINNALGQDKAVIENPNNSLETTYDLLTKKIDTLEAGSEAFLLALPLEANSLKTLLKNLKDARLEVEQELERSKNASAILEEEQYNFIQELKDLNSESNTNEVGDSTTDQSPSTQPDYNKNLEQAQKLVSLLTKMYNNGIDTSNFRDVVLSFEASTDRASILSVFNTLKNLYNLANNANIEGTYEELILSNEEKQDILNKANKLELLNNTGSYTNETDDITGMLLEQIDQLLVLNKLDPSIRTVNTEIYNEIGSDKLAYLAKTYNLAFEEHVTSTGKKYIAITKQDRDTFLNSMLDDRVLNPNFLKIGDSITFVPLVSITMEDGSIRKASEVSDDMKPIGIQVNGEVIEGLYLHDVSWLNGLNLDNDKKGIEADQAKLRELRSKILSSPTLLSTTIKDKTSGVPIMNGDSSVNTVLDVMPNVEIAISKGGSFYSTRNKTIEVVNQNNIKEGVGIIAIPFNGKKLALPVKRQLLQMNQLDTIISAMELYLNKEENETTKELKSLHGIDILDSKGIEQYLNMFVNLNRLNIKSKEDLRERTKTISDNVPIIQFSNGKLIYGWGKQLEINDIYPTKNTGEQRDADLKHLRFFLKRLYSHINLDLLEDNKPVPHILNNGEVHLPFKTYDEFVKDNMITPYLSLKLKDGTDVYTIQGKIKYDIDSLLLPVVEEEESTLSIVDNNTLGQTNEDVLLPNGQVYNFNNVTDFTLSPIDITDSDVSDLIDSSSLIKGVSIETQQSLFKSIANDIYIEIQTDNEIENSGIEVTKYTKLAIDSLDLIVENARANNNPYAEMISTAVNVLKQNKIKIHKGVRAELNKKVNLSKIDSYNTDADVVIDTDEISERNIWLDTLAFTIDPRTSLSKEVKSFLEGIKEKVIDTTSPSGFRDKVNLLNLPTYIPFDIVFNDLLKVMSRNNSNNRIITATDMVSTKYGEQPTYVNNVLRIIEEESEAKPYLLDVVNKLKNAELHIQNSFISALNKTHTNHVYLQSTYNTESKSYSIRSNRSASRNVSNLILSEWQLNLKQNQFLTINDTGKVIVREEQLDLFNDVYQSMVAGIEKDITPSYEDMRGWLALIGVDLHPNVYQLINTKGLKAGEVRLDINKSLILSSGIFKNIKDRINQFNPEFSNVNSLEDEHLFEDKAFKVLAQLTTNYKVNLFTDSFKNSNGDTVYGYTNNRYFTDRFALLKGDANKLQKLTTDPFIKDSTWLNELLVETADGPKINTNSILYDVLEYGTSDGFKIKNNALGKTIDTLDDKDFLKYNFGLYMNNGRSIGKDVSATPIMKVLYPTMSDKANTFTLQVPAKKYVLNNGRLSIADKKGLINTLFMPEINRIHSFNNNPDQVDIAAYKKGAGKFLLFPDLNSEESLWGEDGKLLPGVGIDLEHEDTLGKILVSYINSEYLALEENFNRQGLIVKDRIAYIDESFNKKFSNGNVTETLVNYAINTMVANMNIQQLFIGDPANYYVQKGLDKTNKQLSELYNKQNKTKIDLDEITRLEDEVIPYETQYGSVLETMDNMGKRLAGDNAGKTQYISNPTDTFKVLVVRDNKGTSSNHSKLVELFGEEYAKGYVGINLTDAQEYTTLKEHLRLMLGEGKLTKDVHDRVLDNYNRTGIVSDSDVKVIVGPTKPVYVNNYTRNGIDSRLYIKSSSFPLIKQFTEGKPLDKLRQFMEDNDIDRTAHESAVKVGMPTTIINIYSNKDINIPDNWQDSLLSDVPREGHGNQQEVPYDANKSEVNDGTQQAKLLFTNLLNVDGFINPFTGEQVSGRELANEYLNLYADLFKTKYQALINELDYDTNTGEIRKLYKLKEILVREGLSRNYSINDIASFTLNDLGNKFETELWLNTSDSKIVSLLNSIVDNRVRKRKFRGKSFVLASDSASQIVDVNETDTNNVIRIGNWDGKLKTITKDGQLTYAEILIPFKFWDNNGKLLYIDKFTKKDDKGNTVLDLDKLPEKALEIFGYRIPTSGLNLLATIKVVGFLPSTMGDLAIAPPEFIVAMGSDFDVDKLYTHMYNTHYSNTSGKLEIIENTTRDRYNTVSNSMLTIKEEITRLSKNGISSIEENSIIKTLQDRLSFLQGADLLQLKDINDMLIQNKLLDIHKAVLNSQATEVQYAKNRELSFGMLPSLSTRIGKEKERKGTSLLRTTYQQQKYQSARAGKTAVGVFSLDMVFNSALQYVNTPLSFVNNDLEVLSYEAFGQTSSDLNSEKTSTGKYKSEVIEGFMTAALDNEKEQLLGKLNINNSTFDFIRAGTQLGFDQDVIVGVINQPSVLDYLEKRNQNVEIVLPTITTKDVNSVLYNLSVEDLIEESKGSNPITLNQKAILSFFLQLSEHGRELKIVQSTINSDSSGIGKNMFYSMEKAKQIVELPTKTHIPGIEQVIGRYLSIEEAGEQLEDFKSEGYVQYGNTLIQPSSIGGFAGVYATLFNNQVWQSLYPYTNESMMNIMNFNNIGRNDIRETVSSKADSLQENTISYKSLLSSSQYANFINYTSIQEARKDLLFDNQTHMSLGSIIHDIKTKGKYNNGFLSRLHIGRGTAGIDLEGKLPTSISYYNALTLEMDEEVIINSIIQMITEPTVVGNYNGIELTSRDLLDKLITHQVITGGVQKSGQFLKYIPYLYLKQKGYYTNISDESTSILTEDNSNKFAKILRTQNIQHNPEAYYDETIKPSDVKIVDKIAYVDPIIKKKSNGFIIYKDNDTTYRIFKYHNGLKQFIQIDNLGWKGDKEYDFEADFAGESNIWINQNRYLFMNEKDNTIVTLPSQSEITNFLNIDRDTTEDKSPLEYNVEIVDIAKQYYLLDNNLPIKEKYDLILNKIKDNSSNPITAYFADNLLDITDYLVDVPLYVNTKLEAKGAAITYQSTKNPIQININPNNINSEQDMQNTIIEEMVHAILKKELNTGEATAIHSLYNEIKELAINKYGQSSYDTMVQRLQSGLPLREGVERNIMYSLYNIDEFVAAAIKDETFQKFLNKTEGVYTTKSLWSKIVKMVSDLLVGLGVKKDSNLEAVLHEVLNHFDNINRETLRAVGKPKYVRTIDYLNDRFKLKDSNSTSLTKGNPQEIANFINSNIVNVTATVKGSFVNLESNLLKELVVDKSVISTNMFEDNETDTYNTISDNFINYVKTLDIRINQITASIKKAKAVNDFTKVAQLTETLNKTKSDKANIKEVKSVADLADRANQDIQMISSILNRAMSAEDIVYSRNVIDFWKNAKEQVFDARLYHSDILLEEYGKIEGTAQILSDKLFGIEKDYLTSFVKKQINKDVDLDKVFEDYKDINMIQGNVRDISMYDNALLTSIWASVKRANIDAMSEAENIIEDVDSQLKIVIPILKSLGTAEVFDVFSQRNTKGQKTNHIVKPYTSGFYKDLNKARAGLYASNDTTSLLQYNKWVKENGLSTTLSKIFPVDGIETVEVKNAILDLKAKVGEGTFNHWYKKQELLLQRYQDNKDGYLNHLMIENNLASLDALQSNQELYNKYLAWVSYNSPYVLEDVIFNNTVLRNGKEYNNFRYLEVLPKNPVYLDGNFKTIESNKDLLKFYNTISDVFEELNQYVPEEQQKALAYGGLPSIEKSLVELYSEKGMKFLATPAYDMFIKSMQTSFTSSAKVEIDPVTKKPIINTRVDLIKDHSTRIKDYVKLESSKFRIKHKSEPSKTQIQAYKDTIVDIIANEHSFDLGKITKIYAALVLGHKHKAQLEDSIKIANSVIDSYGEVLRRPDGTTLTNSSGVVQRKDKINSFPNMKKSLDAYTKNVIYGDVKEEEGKGKTILTKTESNKKKEISNLLTQLELEYENGLIDEVDYKSIKSELSTQKDKLGKTIIGSKVGDNVLKYVQLKLMGWNVLGGVSNMGFGYMSNIIEGAGNQLYSSSEINDAYKLVTHSVLKNATFNKVETDIALKIRSGMNKMDILKDASNELNTGSVSNSFNKGIKAYYPYNVNQRTEYLNQAPIMIALAKNTKVLTDKGEISIWEGFDKNWNWNPEYGEEPKDELIKYRLKIDQLVKRNHGNYDNLSSLAIKRNILGRFVSQFRTWLFESVAVRFEAERHDDILGIDVKGRYISAWEQITGDNKVSTSKEFLITLLKQYSFGLVDSSNAFNELVDGNKVKDVDAANMRRVVKEVYLGLNTYLFLLLLSMIAGDDDDDKNKTMNILFNQGTRLKTDLLLYVNPMEARNIVRDIIPATMIVKDSADWASSVFGLFMGEDRIESGVHEGDSRFGSSTMKMLPFLSKGYGIYNSTTQVFDK